MGCCASGRRSVHSGGTSSSMRGGTTGCVNASGTAADGRMISATIIPGRCRLAPASYAGSDPAAGEEVRRNKGQCDTTDDSDLPRCALHGRVLQNRFVQVIVGGFSETVARGR
jgi:hypothetical protein